MATKWTNEQQSAIVSKGQNLLLSAAAGSGKTAVLVERIISRITDPDLHIDADKLLVVTFTNAAAGEMRERIIAALEKKIIENPHDSLLNRQLTKVKNAQITTIDSFCIGVLRKYFVEAQISPDFAVADPTECKVMIESAVDNAINQMYDDSEYADSFLEVVESYTNSKADDTEFKKLLLSIYYFSKSLPDPEKWLDSAAENFNIKTDFSQSRYSEIIMKEIKAEVARIVSDYALIIDLANKDAQTELSLFLQAEKEFFDKCLLIDDYDEIRAKIYDYVFLRRPSKSKSGKDTHFETIKTVRDKKIKEKRVAKLKFKLMNLDASMQKKTIEAMYPRVKCISETVKRIDKEFTAMKLGKNILDFSDCEHRCLKLLLDENGPTEIAKELSCQFDEIYMDEYQDTSKLQEAIFGAVKRENNLFMVGDIKQSIYRFRNTDPLLFRSKRDAFSAEESSVDRKIILSKNFRSRQNILASVNYIFERIMSEEAGEIDYDDSEKLYLGADYPDQAVNPISQDTELAIIDTTLVDSEKQYTKTELQAIYCANRIAELISGGVQIYDKGEYRRITYSDICVVSRNANSASGVISAVFSDFGIPCYSENAGGYFNSREIEIMLSMLSVIDNPYQDLHLLTVLRSIIFNLSTDQLAKVHCYDKRSSFYEAMIKCAAGDSEESALCREIIDTIQWFIKASGEKSVSRLILDIYNRTGFFDAQQTMPNGVVKRANLRLLYNSAKEYEKTGLKGLYSFVKFINDYRNTGSDLETAKLTGENNDAVRIMTIHKSKGLEFPVIILFGAEHEFNLRDLSANILYHAELGYGPKFIDTDKRITYNFAPRAAVDSIRRRESIAEEMRILYVALTRAKEKLIIVGSDKNVAGKIKSCIAGDGQRRIGGNYVLEKKSFLDWIIMVLMQHADGAPLRDALEVEQDWELLSDESRFKVNLITGPGQMSFVQSGAISPISVSAENTDEIISVLNTEYHHKDDTRLVSKVTVTELKKRKQQEMADGTVEAFPKKIKLREKKTGLSAAQIGTAYHTVLQRFDLSAPADTRDDIKNQIEIIMKKGFLTEEEAGAVNPDKILKFFASPTGKMIKAMPDVRREVMFGVSIPAKSFIADTDSDKDIMLQGVIDSVVFTDEGIVIVDYKTDRDFDETDTVEKYRVQLECYKYAAEKIFKKPVISKILFMLDSGMAMTL